MYMIFVIKEKVHIVNCTCKNNHVHVSYLITGPIKDSGQSYVDLNYRGMLLTFAITSVCVS